MTEAQAPAGTSRPPDSPRTDDDIRAFCQDIFAPLSRADQRRAAETYLTGLLTCAGRKSIPRLAALGERHSEQSLQQFINQSPWDPDPIRRQIMNYLARRWTPIAWVLDEVAFPKHGRLSAAVERQYVRANGRVRNCQLAIAVLMMSEGVAAPVNWQLTIPETWGNDTARRERARMPETELPRPYWQYHLEALDHMALEWGMPTAPIVQDARNRPLHWYLDALDFRNLTYLAQSSGSEVVAVADLAPRSRGPLRAVVASRTWQTTLADIAPRLADLPRETIEWTCGEFIRRSQFVNVPLATPPDRAGAGRRSLLVEWPLGKPQPRGYWITNRVDDNVADLVQLAHTTCRANGAIEQLAERYGLRDYEGRTFSGWHHHVTLVSAAYACSVYEHAGRQECWTDLAPAR